MMLPLELVIGMHDRVGYFTPYLETDKFGILKDGQTLVSEN
jgi:hypothetical protein